jgi:hypothetical protein
MMDLLERKGDLEGKRLRGLLSTSVCVCAVLCGVTIWPSSSERINQSKSSFPYSLFVFFFFFFFFFQSEMEEETLIWFRISAIDIDIIYHRIR